MGCNASRSEVDRWPMLTSFEEDELSQLLGPLYIADIEAAFFPILMFVGPTFNATQAQLAKALTELRLPSQDLGLLYSRFLDAFRIVSNDGPFYDLRGILCLMYLKASDDKIRIGEALHTLFDEEHVRHFKREELRRLFTAVIEYIVTFSRYTLRRLLNQDFSEKQLELAEEKRERCVQVLVSCYIQHKWTCTAAQFGNVFAKGIPENIPSFTRIDFSRFETCLLYTSPSPRDS
eukprot:TRINITY_DN4252_c0_g1_i5.p1 TRINITY_DN4252_c0_g1~~TRINITY_DN4252_c0_g1_i5.p1  ORF type:complete len:234 (-),score=25.47 TRINITY_DN4252_c0_g1_i5:41-742(-)